MERELVHQQRAHGGRGAVGLPPHQTEHAGARLGVSSDIDDPPSVDPRARERTRPRAYPRGATIAPRVRPRRRRPLFKGPVPREPEERTIIGTAFHPDARPLQQPQSSNRAHASRMPGYPLSDPGSASGRSRPRGGSRTASVPEGIGATDVLRSQRRGKVASRRYHAAPGHGAR